MSKEENYDEEEVMLEEEPAKDVPVVKELVEEPETTKSAVDWKTALERYPMREVHLGGLHFNPVTSLIGVLFLWGVAIWCMVEPSNAREELIELRGELALYYSWFYIGARPIWLFFILFLAVRYGNVRLGPKDSQPEFSAVSYFAMLFAAGVAIGLFFFGVSEPLWHQSSHWYANEGYHSQDAVDQFAMMITLHHWGFAAWSGYLVVAIASGLAAYRFNLPMTLRTSLYPILGDYTWGWIGDVIDGVTIVVTVAGVCTSLGLGASQIFSGLQRIGWVDRDADEDKETNIQIIIIWVITVAATASVISGLHLGIKYLSDVAFGLGMVILFLVFILENTPFMLNLFVQTIGYYFQWSTFQINFWTDAFGQLREGEGRAVDGKAAAVWWMDAWTVFYMAWWTAWSGFVGLFVARISKGRTIREVVVYGLLCPLFYCAIWFSVFGGSGLRQARQALELEELGKTYYDDEMHFNVNGTVCYDVPQENIVKDIYNNDTGKFEATTVFENQWEGITPVCKFDSADSDGAWFNLMYSFSFPNDFSTGLGGFMSVLSIVAISIYFITSSDSGSLIVDHLAANGHEEHHWLQRLFWAFTEGAVACALLSAGGTEGLQALQAFSIICGLPFSVLMCYMLQSIYVMCERAETTDDEFFTFDESKDFQTPVYGGILNIFEFIFSIGMVHPERCEKGMDFPRTNHLVHFLTGIFLPFVPLSQVLAKLYPRNTVSNMVTVAIYTVMFATWVCLFILVGAVSRSFRAFGWTAFFVNGLIVCSLKTQFREKYNFRGNIIGDFFSGLFFYPQTFVQLLEQAEILGLPEDHDE